MMSQSSSTPARSPMTFTAWLICIIAAIGFLFDTYELLMAPLIVRPALAELLNAKPNTELFNIWNGVLFWVPTLTGGLFGLVGGYLTDLFGRRRMLVASILLYAVSAFTAGFSTSIWMLLFLRCTTMIGVCVEFVAAVAWLAELFPEAKQREAVLGFTQVFGSLGGLLVAEVNHLLQGVENLPEIFGPQDDVWRFTLMSGLIPAIPLLVIRPFLPESPAWAAKKAAGTLKRPSLGHLFAPEFKRTSILCGILFACTLGVAFGAIQQGPGIARAHPSVQSLSDKEKGQIASRVQTYQELGGLAGRVAMAVLLVMVASRRRLLQMFLLPGLIVVPIVYMLPVWGHFDLFRWGVFLAGFFTIAQLSWWGNYLPAVYPVHLRGTGESFAANVGGRMLGASAAMVTSTLALLPSVSGGTGKLGIPTSAAIVGGTIYLIALITSFWLQEPKAETAHE